MEMPQFLNHLLFDYTTRTVAIGSAVLGMVSGALGCYAVLRRQSLLGDAMSHAALPGIVIAYMITGSKSPFVLVLGAALAGWLGTVNIMAIIRNSRIKSDAAMALVLSVYFGFGMVLLTFVQRQPDAAKAGLDTFLFGQAAAILNRDIIVMTIIGSLALIIVAAFWNQFKLLSFDPEFGSSVGLPMKFMDIFLTSLLVVAIVLGLQTVGVVLMSSMVVAPGASARQWTDRMGIMIILAALFGAIAGISGAVVSGALQHMPTGPTIVLCISLIFGISMMLAPNRGLVWRWLRHHRDSKKLQLESVLCDLYSLARQHRNPDHPHETSVLEAMSPGQRKGVLPTLKELESRGWVVQKGTGLWAITSRGITGAENVIQSIGESTIDGIAD